MNPSLAFLIAGLAASALKAYVSSDQATFSRKSVADILIGGAVGLLYPLFPMIPMPANASLIQQAALVGVICYFSSDLLQGILSKLGVTINPNSGISTPPPKVVIGWFLLPAALLMGAGCSSTVSVQKNLHVTALAIDALGEQFEQSVPLMDAALRSRLISVNTWNEYAAFAQAFGTWYPQTYQLWKAAVQANDAISQDNIAQAVTIMGVRLTALTADVIAAASKPRSRLHTPSDRLRDLALAY